jgi:hypothetical protein
VGIEYGTISERAAADRKLSGSRPAVGDGSAQLHRKGRPAQLYRPAITSALDGP